MRAIGTTSTPSDHSSLQRFGVRICHPAVDAWIADMADLFRAFPDWRWRRIQLVVEDDRLAAHLRGSGTHLGAFRGLAATRRHVNVAEFAMYRVTRGRIAEFSGTTGDFELLSQLGDEAVRTTSPPSRAALTATPHTRGAHRRGTRIRIRRSSRQEFGRAILFR